MIEVKEVSKRYEEHEVLRKVSFQIQDNEVFALLGPNGAGKTTMLECMEGLRKYEKGKIEIMGLNPEEAVKKKWIGIQLQSSSLPENMNAGEAMRLFCTWNGIQERKDLLEVFGLEKMQDKKYKTMSTGQKRKLHLALALANDPKILFLDEPTAGLDVEARVSLHNEIRALKKKGITIVLASHDMAEVEALCDRVAILVDRSIRKIASPSEIVLEVQRESMIKVRVSKDINQKSFQNLSFEKKKEGVFYYKSDHLEKGLMELLKRIEEVDGRLLDLAIDKPTLEERFIEIAKEKM